MRVVSIVVCKPTGERGKRTLLEGVALGRGLGSDHGGAGESQNGGGGKLGEHFVLRRKTIVEMRKAKVIKVASITTVV